MHNIWKIDIMTNAAKRLKRNILMTQNLQASVTLGDIAKSKVDAIVVPEFTGGASYGGVGGAVARSGAEAGLKAYDDFVAEAGQQPFSTALLTPSGGGQSPYLLHVVSVGSAPVHEFYTIKTAFFNALQLAGEKGITSIAAPALGTGIIGSLTAKQSAEAMFSALKEYRESGGKDINVKFVIYGDQKAYDAFNAVLKSGSYATSNEAQEGRKAFNAVNWAASLQQDAEANKAYFSKRNGPKP